MDAITLLTQQHEEAKALFEQIEATQDNNEKQRLLTEVMAALYGDKQAVVAALKRQSVG